MTEFEKLDTDQNGSLSKDEFAKLDVLNKRLTIQDADAKRNLERKLVTMSALGLVLYPFIICLLYTSPSPRDLSTSRMPSSA